MVDDWPLAESIEARNNLFPSGLCFLWGIVGDGDASDAISTEEEARCIELRHDATAPADNTNATGISKHRDDLVEKRASNVVHYDVHSLGRN